MSVKRYDLIERTSGMQVWQEMAQRPDGAYVTYVDYALEKEQADFAVSLLCSDSQLPLFMDKFCKPPRRGITPNDR